MDSILDKEFQELKLVLEELGYREVGSSGNWWEQSFFSSSDKTKQLSSLLKIKGYRFSVGQNKDGHLVFSDMKSWSIISIGIDSIVGKQHKGHYMKIVMDAVPMKTQKNESKNIMKIKVSQLKKVIREVLEEAGQHKCEECGKVLSAQDKSSYETEGGEGWPSVCEDCAEDAALSEASSEIEVDYIAPKKKAPQKKKASSALKPTRSTSDDYYDDSGVRGGDLPNYADDEEDLDDENPDDWDDGLFVGKVAAAPKKTKSKLPPVPGKNATDAERRAWYRSQQWD